MSKKIIAVTGYSASGKSTVINQIHKMYNCSVIRFGAIHKECVKSSGHEYAKSWIKEEGTEPYDNRLVWYFKNYLISAINNNNDLIVIDGIFSHKCFRYLKHISSIDLINVSLDTEDSIRLKRIIKREGLSYTDAVKHLNTADSIKKYVGLYDVIKDSDYCINGNKSEYEIRQEVSLILYGMECMKKSDKKEFEER